jgi:hypothetical protein
MKAGTPQVPVFRRTRVCQEPRTWASGGSLGGDSGEVLGDGVIE